MLHRHGLFLIGLEASVRLSTLSGCPVLQTKNRAGDLRAYVGSLRASAGWQPRLYMQLVFKQTPVMAPSGMASRQEAARSSSMLVVHKMREPIPYDMPASANSIAQAPIPTSAHDMCALWSLGKTLLCYAGQHARAN